jgi:hypothetical protein
MNRRTVHVARVLTVTALMAATVSAAKKNEEIPLTAQGEQLRGTYAGMLEALRSELMAAAPAIDEQKKAQFLAAHAAVEAVPARPKPEGAKHAPPQYAPGYDLYATAQAIALTAARGILADADSFLARDTLDAKLAKCALLAHATPRGLAAFAQQSKEHEALIDRLLNDEALIRQIMSMGGAYEGRYGEAMEIYTAIQKASPRAHDGFFQRWALAVSLENTDREGVARATDEGLTPAELGVLPDDAEPNEAAAPRTGVDVMVEMYLNYEQAYLAGELDPAFDSHSDFNFRFVFPERSLEDAIWMRKMMRNYRPDHITNPDYRWRYCGIVKTDVPYTSNVRRPVRPDLGLTQMQDFFLEGGICGPRAFTGKLATAAFGIPTRGARQTGHAAMCRWTPEGWTTVFGAHWTFNSWRGRCGLDFVLETQARDKPEEFAKVLRAQWLGDAFAEEKVNPMAYGVGGGLWKALGFYKQLAIVEDSKVVEVAPTGEELAESNDPAEAEKVAEIEIPEADRKITLTDDGAIIIPAGACVSPAKIDGKVRFMQRIDGGVQLHYSLGGKRPELVRYQIEAPAAGKYDLTAEVVTVALDQILMLRLNRRTMIDVPVPYTRGMWKQTPPVTVELKAGKNTLEFTAEAPNKGVSIKAFTLTPVEK